METALSNPTVQLVLIALGFTLLVTLTRYAGRTKIDTMKATGEILQNGKRNYRRRKFPLGVLDWGKGQWFQVTVLGTVLYILPERCSSFFGEVPVVVSPFVSVIILTIVAIGIHSLTKNSGQSDPVQMVGEIGARWFKQKMEKLQ